MLDEEDYLWRKGSGHMAVHLIAGQHEILGNLKITKLILASGVDAMKMAQSQKPCSKQSPDSKLVLIMLDELDCLWDMQAGTRQCIS